MKGSVFLLPTVTDADAEEHFPGYKTCEVPSSKKYLRLFPAEQLSECLNKYTISPSTRNYT
jgi:hypothetical protein